MEHFTNKPNNSPKPAGSYYREVKEMLRKSEGFQPRNFSQSLSNLIEQHRLIDASTYPQELKRRVKHVYTAVFLAAEF